MGWGQKGHFLTVVTNPLGDEGQTEAHTVTHDALQMGPDADNMHCGNDREAWPDPMDSTSSASWPSRGLPASFIHRLSEAFLCTSVLAPLELMFTSGSNRYHEYNK